MPGPSRESLLNPDFRDMLCALFDADAEFLVVGAYAMAVHGLPRATGDLDPTDDNAARVWEALRRFQAPLSKLSLNDLTTSEIVIQMGVAPNRIDLLTTIDGIDFADAWLQRLEVTEEAFTYYVISRDHLLQNKKATGRPKDIADAAWLEEESDGDSPANN